MKRCLCNANRYKIASNKTRNHILRLLHKTHFICSLLQNHKFYYLYVNFVIYCHFHADKLQDMARRTTLWQTLSVVSLSLSFGCSLSLSRCFFSCLFCSLSSFLYLTLWPNRWLSRSLRPCLTNTSTKCNVLHNSKRRHTKKRCALIGKLRSLFVVECKIFVMKMKSDE